MRFYKLRVTPKAASIATTFNEQFQPDIIPQNNDPYRFDWIQRPVEEVYIGENVKASRLRDSSHASVDIKTFTGSSIGGSAESGL
jgi:actin-related protein 8